jgi:hypothetical protein
MKHVGDAWKALTPADRQTYLIKADEDKVRYLRAMKVFYR